jgi:hypothetical protein
LVKVLLVGWLVAGSEEDWWQSVVGSLIQVCVPGDIRYSVNHSKWMLELGLGLLWSLTQNGASVDILV